MDCTLAMIIHPMLVQLKATQHGHPASLTEQEWDQILDEMIWAFGHKSKEMDAGDNETQERLTNAFMLFGKYYENLWD
jgi:hypothetical protein